MPSRYVAWTSYEGLKACGSPVQPDTLYHCLRHENEAPTAEPGAVLPVECASSEGAVVAMDGAGSADPDGDALGYLWEAPGITFDDPGSPTPTATFPIGRTTVTLTVSDGCPSEPVSTVVEVVDTTPPTITVDLDRESLWPPNHALVDVHARVTVGDLCDPSPSLVLTSITSDEADDGLGDADTEGDVQGATPGVADVAFQLRAERSGSGDGRTYRVTYTATDDSGNSADAAAEVHVAHHGGP